MTIEIHDYIDGEPVPPRIVQTGSESITGEHRGSVIVRDGAEVNVSGVLMGSLVAESASLVTVAGTVQGSVHVGARSEARIIGRLSGSLHVDRGGSVTVETPGRLSGSVSNFGRLRIEGIFGGPITGDGELSVASTATILKPRVVDGVNVYDWSDFP